MQCNVGERRVWVQRGAGPQKQIIFSSTFDSVLSGDVTPPEMYKTAAEPAVAAASDGKVGCLLCIGPASAIKEASVFGQGADPSDPDQMALAARSLCEMVKLAKGRALTISVVQASDAALIGSSA